MSFLIHDALHQEWSCALQQPLSGLELRYNYVQTVSKQIYCTEAHQTSGLGTEIWGSRAPLSSDKNPFLPMTSVFKHSRHVYVVTLARRRLDLKSSWRSACFVVSGDPTGAVAARLPEDSCVNEAHCAPREYMVLCTSFGTKGVRADDTVCHYSLTILEKATLKFSVSLHNRYKISRDEKCLFFFGSSQSPFIHSSPSFNQTTFPLFVMNVHGSSLSAFITFKELSILGKSCCPQPVTRLLRLNFWKDKRVGVLKQG